MILIAPLIAAGQSVALVVDAFGSLLDTAQPSGVANSLRRVVTMHAVGQVHRASKPTELVQSQYRALELQHVRGSF
jgi:dihydropteroate synthase